MWGHMSTTDLPGPSLLAGRYRLVERLGSGGMSVVWRGFDEVLGRQVAVKVLPQANSADPSFRRRLRAEAQAAARLSHPHITNVYDYGEATSADGSPMPFVVMELVDGESLAAVLARVRVLPWPAAVRICAEVAAALAAAHARGIVHRDVTPANVMLTASGAKVVDFGISALIGENDIDPDGSLLGTPAYLAPERLEGGQVSPATDVYAVGLLIYRTLIGQLPWDVGTTTALLRAHQYTEPEPLPPVEGLPPAVAALVGRCLEKLPDDRPSSAELAHVLAGIVAQGPKSSPLVADWGDPSENTTILPWQHGTADVPRPSVTPPVRGLASGSARPVAARSSSGAVYGVPVSGVPVSGVPVSGVPVSGVPVSGGPASGVPVSGAVVSAGQGADAPVSGAPVSGAPVSGAPVSGVPVSGVPVSGVPVEAPGAVHPVISAAASGSIAGGVASGVPGDPAAGDAAGTGIVPSVPVAAGHDGASVRPAAFDVGSSKLTPGGGASGGASVPAQRSGGSASAGAAPSAAGAGASGGPLQEVAFAHTYPHDEGQAGAGRGAAGHGPNGAGPDGRGPNGYAPNGYGPNGHGRDGHGAGAPRTSTRRRRALVAVGAVAAVGAAGYGWTVWNDQPPRDGSAQAALPHEPGPRSCVVTYSVLADDGKKFKAGLTVTNNAAAAIADWNLRFVLLGDQKLTGHGGLKLKQQGHDVVAESSEVIHPSRTVVLDMSGGYQQSNAVPVAFALNGLMCDAMVSPRPGAAPRPVRNVAGPNPGGVPGRPGPDGVVPIVSTAPGGVVVTVGTLPPGTTMPPVTTTDPTVPVTVTTTTNPPPPGPPPPIETTTTAAPTETTKKGKGKIIKKLKKKIKKLKASASASASPDPT
jgi:serine/threonine protein kinase